MIHISRILPIVLFITVIIVSFVTSSPTTSSPVVLKRHKRHILQMCELIAHHTNRGCLDFNNYGCFCGLGNAASRHVDGVDRCCRVHDRCYGRVSCFWMYPQMVGYDVNCDEDGCECKDSQIFSACARSTCECDLEFAQCLGRQRYHHEFSDYDRRECNRPPIRSRRERRRIRRMRRSKRKNRQGLSIKQRFLRFIGL